MKTKTHTRKWFLKRIGKIVFRGNANEKKYSFILQTPSQCEAHYQYQFNPLFNWYFEK